MRYWEQRKQSGPRHKYPRQSLGAVTGLQFRTAACLLYNAHPHQALATKVQNRAGHRTNGELCAIGINLAATWINSPQNQRSFAGMISDAYTRLDSLVDATCN